MISLILGIIFLLGIIISTIIVTKKYILNYYSYSEIPFGWKAIAMGCGFGLGLLMDNIIQFLSNGN